MSGNVAVRLIKAYGRNNAGEICGFPGAQARGLIKAGVAMAIKADNDPVSERQDKMEHGEQRRPRRTAPKAEADGN